MGAFGWQADPRKLLHTNYNIRGIIMRPTNKEIILDCIIDLHNSEQTVTRELLLDVLDLKKNIIDDNVTSLVNEGRVYRVRRGVYAPSSTHPKARHIWKGTLSCGLVKLEIGDIVITLTPKEARILGKEMMGDGMQYANIELGHYVAQMNTLNDLKTKELERENKQLRLKVIKTSTGYE